MIENYDYFRLLSSLFSSFFKGITRNNFLHTIFIAFWQQKLAKTNFRLKEALHTTTTPLSRHFILASGDDSPGCTLISVMKADDQIVGPSRNSKPRRHISEKLRKLCKDVELGYTQKIPLFTLPF